MSSLFFPSTLCLRTVDASFLIFNKLFGLAFTMILFYARKLPLTLGEGWDEGLTLTLFDDLIVAQLQIESLAFKNFSALKKSIDEKIIFVRQYSKIIKIIWLECAPLKRMTVLVLTNMNTIALSHYRTISHS